MQVRNYRDLHIWQKAVDLAVAIYSITRSFPKEEQFGLTSQMRRAVVSISSNIAEGQARNTTGEFKQFLGIAKGSLAELDTQTEIAKKLALLDDPNFIQLRTTYDQLGKMLNGLIKTL